MPTEALLSAAISRNRLAQLYATGADPDNVTLQWLGGGPVDATLLGGEIDDLIFGAFGPYADNDFLVGADVDVAFYRGVTDGITVNMADPTQSTGEAVGDTFFDIENLGGSDFADTLTGSSGGGQVCGFAGADTLTGQGGSDVFYGGVGADTITSGGGADDHFFLRFDGGANEGGDRFTDFQSGVDKITVSRFWFGFGNIAGPAAALTSANADFIINGAAANARAKFLWNTTTRELWFDQDGNGVAAATLLATLQTGGTIALSDIWTA